MTDPAQNATQKDALEQLDDQASGATNETGADEVAMSPRIAAMEAIAAQRRESLVADGVDVGKPEKKTDQDPGQKPEPSADDQLAAQLSQDDKPTAFADPSLRVKVKVDGEELEVPLSDVVKSYQKDSAASKRLEEATRLLKLAEQTANKVAHEQKQENNSVSSATDGVTADGKTEQLGKIKGVFSKLYEGDEEGAAEEMLQLIGQGVVAAPTTHQPIDPTQIASQVRQQLAVESAYGEVQTDYPELFSQDERGVVLGKATVERMTAKEAAGTPRDKALRESAEEVAKLFGIEKAGRQQAAPQRTARDTKLERKANLDIPESANAVAGKPTAPAEAPNVSSVIAEMAKARLGQSMNPR